MSEHDLVEDYTLQPVPAEQTMRGRQIAMVILAIGFTLPVFALGAQVTQAQGLVRGTIACFAGCLLAALLSLPTSFIGARLRLSTYVILMLSFGRVGGRIVNLMLAATLIGWFANVADILGVSVSASLGASYGVTVPAFACTAIALVLMTLTGIFGFRLMERFATLLVPVLCAFMGYVLYLALAQASPTAALARPGTGDLSFADAVSAVFGLVVLTAVLSPDFTRYARRPSSALLAMSALGIGYPLIMLIAAVPAAVFGEADIMRIMVSLGLTTGALIVLVLATWASNTGNLYSATLTLATVAPRVPVWQLGVGTALFALVAGYFHVSDYFVPFLVLLGIAAVPVAGVYCCVFFFSRPAMTPSAGEAIPAFRHRNLTAWVGGSAVGYASSSLGGFLCPLPALEALAATAVLWLALHASVLAGPSRRRVAPVAEPE